MKKNRILLWADIVWNEKWQVLFLAILLCVVSIANCYSFAKYREYNYYHEIIPYMDNSYFYDNEDMNNMADKIYYSTKREDVLISKENKVYDCLFCGSAEEISGYTEDDKTISLFSLPIDIGEGKIHPVRCVDGKILTKLNPNEVILDGSMEGKHEVGDVIECRIDHVQREEGEIKLQRNIRYDLKVVAFTANTERLVDSLTVYPKSLNRIYVSMQDLKGQYDVGGIISYLDNGESVAIARTYLPMGCIFFLHDGYNEDDLHNELKAQGFDDGGLTSYRYLLEKYDKDYADEIRTSKIMLTVSAILTIAVIMSAFFSNYIHKRKELAVYNLLGSTWSESIIISLTPYVLSIILGTILGWTAWTLFTFAGNNGALRLPLIYFAQIFVIYLIIYSLMGLIYYLFYYRMNPVDQYRTRE